MIPGLVEIIISSTLIATGIVSLYRWQTEWMFSGKEISHDLRAFKKTFITDDNSLMDMIVINRDSNVDVVYLSGNSVDEDEIYFICQKISVITGANVFAPLYSGVNNDYKRSTEENLEKDFGFLSKFLSARDTLKIVFGFSFGSAPAVRLAATVAGMHELMLMNPFISVPTLVEDHTKVRFITPLVSNRWENEPYFREITVPCCYFISEDDKTIPPYHSETLAALTSKSKKVFVHGAGHNDIKEPDNFDKFVKPQLLKAIENIK